MFPPENIGLAYILLRGVCQSIKAAVLAFPSVQLCADGETLDLKTGRTHPYLMSRAERASAAAISFHATATGKRRRRPLALSAYESERGFMRGPARDRGSDSAGGRMPKLPHGNVSC
jgi:hypothetical protein